MKFLLSLFAKPRYEQLIRQGVMYRRTFKGYRLVKEEPMEVFGGFTRLNEVADNRTLGDRKCVDLNVPSPQVEHDNIMRKPEFL